MRPTSRKSPRSEAGSRITDVEVASWLEKNGYAQPILIRYGEWLGVWPGWTRTDDQGRVTGRCIEQGADPAAAPRRCGVLQGDWGYSTVFKEDVSSIVSTRLWQTGKLMFWVMVVMVPSALLIGVLAGMREGSRLDRTLSTISIAHHRDPGICLGRGLHRASSPRRLSG